MCGPLYLHCMEGKCISSSQLCDGMKDCQFFLMINHPATHAVSLNSKNIFMKTDRHSHKNQMSRVPKGLLIIDMHEIYHNKIHLPVCDHLYWLSCSRECGSL